MNEIQNIPKIYTALAEWSSCFLMVLVYRSFINGEKKRIMAKLLISFLILSAVQIFCRYVSDILWLTGMAAAVVVMGMTLKAGMGVSGNVAAYLCARAFMRAELMASLEWQIFSFYFEEISGTSLAGIGFCICFYAISYVFFYWIERKQLPENLELSCMEVTKEQQLLVWIVMLLMFALSNLSYTEVKTPFTGMEDAEVFNIRSLVDLAGVLMLELIHMQKMNTDKLQEMAAIRNLLSLQYSQFKESQENIEMLNCKYHDLKHQIQVIREEGNNEKRNDYLKEIEQEIRFYDSEIQTGNNVLNTILTSKSRQCTKFQITLTVVADGILLRHLHVTDLCTIFGNALDNAIEYEVQVADVTKRLIHVRVAQKNKIVCVVIENYYEGMLMIGNGLPETTKSDKDYHGYGLKSIRYAVHKYGGYFNMNEKDHWFRLEMLFPAEEISGESEEQTLI